MSQGKKLNVLLATSICGNDITSSCLYVSAIAITYAGQYAWAALLIVSGVLFLFRKIYAEAVGALPLNGGAYNILLNTTSKGNASVAACLTILSYMATAVISASEAINYLHSIFPIIPIVAATFFLLLFFLGLNILGISESAKVAAVIFIIHLTAISILIISLTWYLVTNGFATLTENFSLPVKGSISSALFFGFSAAMLGISGFESSANYVEEQKQGVFTKTLRNMWALVTFINPAIAFLAICVIPMAVVGDHEDSLLSYLGNQTGGSWLAWVISLDAGLVLSGAVLTSFVGVGGLIKRMALDRILPQFFLKENKRGSSPRILIVFFLLCVSILFITEGELESMAGVYTISFLTVMIFFAIGNLLLKIKRSRLPRPEYAEPYVVAIALIGVTVGLYGNIKLHPEFLVMFLQYFFPSILVIYALKNRNQILEFSVTIITSFFDILSKFSLASRMKIKRVLVQMHSQQFVFFSKTDDISILNKVMIYVSQNEITNTLKI
ncbi:MAG: APC family permease [Bacteroidia bacterium]|nr:APC family permease [Bacteroidia bacterium]